MKKKTIDLSHGAGGIATHRLIKELFLPAFNNQVLERLTDASIVNANGSAIAMTTDAFVVRPLSFPGGSIGDLAVNGTVNDLVVSGAQPLALSVAMVMEEGLEMEVLQREVDAMAKAAKSSGVSICTGDTKVVERGHGDGLYIVTTGIGLVDPAFRLSAEHVVPGDKIICSGTIGDHGTAIMIARGELDLEAEVKSDTCSLLPMVNALKQVAGEGVRWMRDPTRGGVGTTLNELAEQTQLGVILQEERIRVREEVQGACEILGIDPLYVANEGKLLAVVASEYAEQALLALRKVPGAEEAEIIGEISETPADTVLMQTSLGGRRVIEMLVGDPLPRIC